MPTVRFEKCGHELPNKMFVDIFSMIQKKHECPLCAAHVINEGGSERKKEKLAKRIAICFIGTHIFRVGGDEYETKCARFEREYTTFFAALPPDMLLLIAKVLDE